jgi:hypothetical protein
MFTIVKKKSVKLTYLNYLALLYYYKISSI